MKKNDEQVAALEWARAKWPGMGAFAEQDPTRRSVLQVGFHDSTPFGCRRVVMGEANTWPEAMARAEKANAKRLAPPPPRPRKTPREGKPFPIAGDLLDGGA